MRKILLVALTTLFALASFAQDKPAAGDSPALTLSAGAVLRLEDVVREALSRNPSISAGLHTVAAQRAKVPQASAFPEPNFGVGWMGNARPFSVQTGDPSSYRSVSAMQSIPFPGKLGLRARVAGKEADISQWDVEAVRRRVAADVKAAYYDYWYYDKAIQTARRNRELLSKLSQVAEARYRVGRSSQPDVLRSQVETTMLLQKLTTLEQMRATSQARLNALLARRPGEVLPPAADLSSQTPLAYSLDEIFAMARGSDPESHKMQNTIERSQFATRLAQKDYRPDLAVGYMYEQRPQMPDMHGFTFTVNLPVFYRTRQREAVKQVQEEGRAAESARENRQNELYFDLQQNYLALQASDQLLKLYSQGIVPQSSLALESAMAAYQVGTVDFLTVLQNFGTVLNYETDYYREMANYHIALARLEALAGVDLSARQTAPATPAN